MNKYSSWGGQNTYKINPLFKDIKEYNKYLLSLIGIFVLLLTGIISYNYTNTSYAKWNSSVESNNVLKLSVKSNNKPNAPALTSNMIPVYYDETNEVWRKADSTNKNNKWYDYDNKIWANAVTVSEQDGYTENVTSSSTVSLSNDVTYSKTTTSGTKYTSLGIGYVLSSSYSFDTNTGQYTLSGSTITVTSSNATSISNKYMCNNGTDTTCTQMIYLKSYDGTATLQGTTRYRYTSETYTSTSSVAQKYLASSYTFNKSTGVYTLSSPSLSAYSTSSVGKYTCDSSTSSTCNKMYKIVTAEENKVTKADVYEKSINLKTSTKYNNASVGTEISMDDISTMWVWIPRYKYTMLANTCANIKNPTEEVYPGCYEYVYKDEYHDDLVNELVDFEYVSDETEAEEVVTAWKNGEADDYLGLTFEEYVNPDNNVTELTFDKSFISTNDVDEQPFDIEFESGINSTGTIKCTDAVTGTSSTSETCTDSTNGSLIAGTSTYTHPAFTFGDTELTGIWVGKFEVSSGQIIKPNVTSLRSQTVYQFYTGIYNMRNSDNGFGFVTTDETHMMKNMEWGAVTYLSHSKYGINKEIAINSANTYTTGCGPQREGSTSSGSTCNAYNTTLGQSASTTGNVYGVYDMSGGTYEYVMGNMVNSSGTFYSSSAGFSTAPDTKYYDKYSYGTSETEYTRGKLGDATKEMAPTGVYGNWYSDFAGFPYSYNSWFVRGGGYGGGSNAGAFSFLNHSGYADINVSSRAVVLGAVD